MTAEKYSVNTYTYLYATAKWINESKIPPQFPGYEIYKRISFHTFLALTVESFLNHIGSLRFEWWSSAERSLNTKAKLDIILHESHLKLKKGERPLQNIYLLLKFRNNIVHGKTELISLTRIKPFDKRGRFHLTSWGSILEKLQDQEVFEDVGKFADFIWKAHGMKHPSPFGIMGGIDRRLRSLGV